MIIFWCVWIGGRPGPASPGFTEFAFTVPVIALKRPSSDNKCNCWNLWECSAKRICKGHFLYSWVLARLVTLDPLIQSHVEPLIWRLILTKSQLNWQIIPRFHPPRPTFHICQTTFQIVLFLFLLLPPLMLLLHHLSSNVSIGGHQTIGCLS